MSDNDLTPGQLHERALSADDRKVTDVERVRIAVAEKINELVMLRAKAKKKFNLKAVIFANKQINECKIVLQDLKDNPEKVARQFIEVVQSDKVDKHRQRLSELGSK